MSNKKDSTQKTDGALYTKMTVASLKTHTFPEINFVCKGSEGSAQATRLKQGFNKSDYLEQRPESRLPTGHSQIIATCQGMYRKVGMIRNIIDLMADFASEGLEFKHPIKSYERFFEKWAEKVDLQSRSHDFMKLLLRDANVCVKRKNATIDIKKIREMSKAFLSSSNPLLVDNINDLKVKEDVEPIVDDPKANEGEIPWEYHFISPVFLEKLGGRAAAFWGGGDRVAIRLPDNLLSSIKNPKSDIGQEFVKTLPKELKVAADNTKSMKLTNKRYIVLDPDTIHLSYYKKDDWESWGTPFLFGVIDDILLKEKMKLADMSALDSVINTIRIWKLGDHKEKILPSANAVNKLLGILQNNVGGGVLDLVWDSMIDLQIEYPPLDKILGEKKYLAVNRDIMRGLGVPDALVGGTDLATRNAETAFVQLKTLIERLEYIRNKCLKWINGELRRVADAVGFKNIPEVSFGTMSLRDEAKEKQLMIQLIDRGIVSVEAVHETFGKNFMIEMGRLRQENKMRDADEPIIERAGPYYRPKSVTSLQQDFRLELEAVKLEGSGGENPDGDQPRDEGNNDSGRPPNTQDIAPRDDRTEKVLSVYKILAEKKMSEIDEIIDPLYLGHKGAKTLRSLSKHQSRHLEKIKRSVLGVLGPDDRVDRGLIHARSGKDYFVMASIFEKMFKEFLSSYRKITETSIGVNERRSLAASAWASMQISIHEGE